jgi:hypothetical protein
MLKTTPFHARTAPLVQVQPGAGRAPGRQRHELLRREYGNPNSAAVLTFLYNIYFGPDAAAARSHGDPQRDEVRAPSGCTPPGATRGKVIDDEPSAGWERNLNDQRQPHLRWLGSQQAGLAVSIETSPAHWRAGAAGSARSCRSSVIDLAGLAFPPAAHHSAHPADASRRVTRPRLRASVDASRA